MTTIKYEQLPNQLIRQMEADKAAGRFGQFAFLEENVQRRDPTRDKHTLLRPAFVRDCEKILHLPVYNRYNDKTQVFSFYENDDLTRRGLHVQLVSRVARNIGRLLGLNLDLIEAIALGHDLGHTPFGHAGERFLDQLLYRHTGRHFLHNLHSVRVLDTLYRRNMSLQVLDGILCHNGEFEQQEYRPLPSLTFEELDGRMEACYTEGESAAKAQLPSTLEGCVVRVSDMIAYLGKDRQDAITAKIIENMDCFTATEIGTQNAAIINNLVVDIVTGSYGKDHLSLSTEAFEALSLGKRENGTFIYRNEAVDEVYGQTVEPMFENLYRRLLEDIKKENTASPIYRHHIEHLRQNTRSYRDTAFDYLNEDPHQIVVDYLASMTDRYFIQLHQLLFPQSSYQVEYTSYFEDL